MTKRKRRVRRQRRRESDRARHERLAKAERTLDPGREREQLAGALEALQDAARKLGIPSVLRLVAPKEVQLVTGQAFPSGRARTKRWASPWLIVGRFVWRVRIGYRDLWAILRRWSAKRLLARIHPNRIGRIRVDYVTNRGKRGDYGLGETAPWNLALARAMEACDPSDGMSLAARYKTSQIESVYVWLSSAHD